MSISRSIRRARPALGTIVELGVRIPEHSAETANGGLDRAWRALAHVEAALSAYDPCSDVGRFNSAPAGTSVKVGAHAAAVLRASADLARDSSGLFDVTQGSGPRAWAIRETPAGVRVHKGSSTVRLDLGGIAKGYAVDRAFEVLAATLQVGEGEAACWVNAGGDLRVGGVALSVFLRDEVRGGARPWLELSDGALATSRYGPGARSRLWGAPEAAARHVTVAAPRCMWSDALSKVVALTGRADHPLLARHQAVAWLHGEATC
ncbi:MAG TPA: FAD:protein FMN transferase [Anaeromyxobacteraceae bacterium]|nr:FAD:protein FMN transferase [Anaeromyxobacteraceae bacterium]